MRGLLRFEYGYPAAMVGGLRPARDALAEPRLRVRGRNVDARVRLRPPRAARHRTDAARGRVAAWLGQPLAGVTVADLTRQLPGPFAGRELLRLGARVTKVEPPEGDSMAGRRPGGTTRSTPARRSSPGTPRASRRRRLCSRRTSCSKGSGRASGSASASSCPATAIVCSITGFGATRPARRRRGARPELPRLRRRPRRHGPVAAAGADRRPRRRRAGRGDRGARRAARARADGPRRAHRGLDDARRAPPRVASAGRRSAAAACSRAASPATGSTRRRTAGS